MADSDSLLYGEEDFKIFKKYRYQFKKNYKLFTFRDWENLAKKFYKYNCTKLHLSDMYDLSIPY